MQTSNLERNVLLNAETDLNPQPSIERWDSLYDYMSKHCINFKEKVFTQSNKNTPMLNLALENMHTRAGFEYICKHVSAVHLAEIIKRDGLPLPFILESDLEVFTKKALLNPSSLLVQLKDKSGYSDWVNRLLSQIEQSFIPSELPTQLPTRNLTGSFKCFKNICLTPEECDLYEVLCLMQGKEVHRYDGLSVLNDPAILNLINLYKYLNNRTHKILLCEVVQSNLDYLSCEPNDLFLLAEEVIKHSNGIETEYELPESLNYIVTLCRCYKQGVTFEGLTTFITVMVDTPCNLDINRLALVNQYLKGLPSSYISNIKHLDFKLNLLNSLLTPQINANNTLISTSVNLDHIQIVSGKQITLFQQFDTGILHV